MKKINNVNEKNKNSVNDFINYIKDNYLGDVFTNYSFKDLTTLKIGGQIACLYKPYTLDDLFVAYRYIIEENIPYYIIGNGSNILASDKVFNIVVISLKELNKITRITNNKFIVGSGVLTNKLAFELAKQGYTKQEFLSVIPGTIGGAIYMNAGAYNSSMEDIVYDVTYLTEKGKLITLSKKELDFEYRSSIFKKLKGIIVSVTIELDKALVKNAPLEKIATYKRNKKETQPINVLSAGSTFKNINDLKAWQIVDKLGYRGYIYNGVMVSTNHSNYIINNGNATYNDMITLLNIIKKEAKEKLNIELECEWEIIN